LHLIALGILSDHVLLSGKGAAPVFSVTLTAGVIERLVVPVDPGLT
jgi:hypothetical protein